ncbi:MAG: DUF1588 domain-containing protein, partial [Pseudomonadota bacterium]
MKLQLAGLAAVLTLALATAPLYAVTPGMTALPTGATDGNSHAARFAIGLTIDGGQSFQSSALLNQHITLKGSFDPDAEHVGHPADVFVVKRYDGKYAMLTPANSWVPWSGKTDELQPFLNDAVLRPTQELTLYQGGIARAGQHRIYLSYRPANSSTFIYSSTPAVLDLLAATADPVSYFGQDVFDDVVMTKCTLCHTEKGVAAKSRLHFIKDANQLQQNYDRFKNFYQQLGSDGYNYVLAKVSGNGHAGGNQLPQGSAGYQQLSAFLDLLDGAPGITAPNAPSLFDGVLSQSAADTLRDASLLLAGRLPTAAETAAVRTGGDASLKNLLIEMMQGPHFHKFLKDGADDRLFLRGNIDFNLMDDCATCYPQLVEQYWQLKEKVDADNSSAADRTALNLWLSQINYSTIEAPLELIAYVVEHDKPYTEILTADYDMLTPVLNAAVGGTATFNSSARNTDFAPGRITDYHLRDSGTVTQAAGNASFPRILTAPQLVVNYPHAGVLSSKAFLSRYGSTATNRNRARARWTYLHFLGVDIEAQAKRTTDPVALADTNNPTMNNPACTVCHSVLDPVAGAFQLFSDNGTFRSALNGTDALDAAYKSARTAKLYVTGDTWYRDMRAPGFEGAAANNDSLRWLATQIVKDKRFAAATVKFWWPAVMGSELLKAPETTDDTNYKIKLSAYEAQQAEVKALAARFTQSGYSLKQLLAELVLSKWYRADKLSGKAVNGDA